MKEQDKASRDLSETDINDILDGLFRTSVRKQAGIQNNRRPQGHPYHRDKSVKNESIKNERCNR